MCACASANWYLCKLYELLPRAFEAYLFDPGPRKLLLHIEDCQCIRTYVSRKVNEGHFLKILMLRPGHKAVLVFGNPRVPHSKYHLSDRA